MSTRSPFTKNIPSLNEWLGDGSRGEGFEQWVSLVLSKEHRNEDEAAALRIMQTLCVAAVESGNAEFRRGRPFDETARYMARGMGVVCFSAVASCLREGTDWRDIAVMLTEEFRHGAKVMAETMNEASERADDSCSA
jgi:hypothetical protein